MADPSSSDAPDLTLDLTVTLEPRGPAAAVVLSDEQVASISGGKKVLPVTVTINGGYTFEGRIARMGGENLIGLNKAHRTAASVEAGDTAHVRIVAETAPRTVDVPDDLADAMATAGVAEKFASMAPSHRTEYVRWITEAKKPETRTKRVGEAIERIAESQPRK